MGKYMAYIEEYRLSSMWLIRSQCLTIEQAFVSMGDITKSISLVPLAKSAVL